MEISKDTQEELNRENSKYKNPYHVGYNMLTSCLETDDFEEGMSSALEIAQDYMDSSSIVVLKEDKNGEYKTFGKANNQSRIRQRIFEKVLQKKSVFVKNNPYVDLFVNDASVDRITTMSLLDGEYILAISNNGIFDYQRNLEFMGIMKKTITDLLKKHKRVEEFKHNSEIDALTLLYNRMAYRKKEEELNEDSERPITLALIDLFRLKYTNDNINHAAGDKYISQTARLLKDAFKKEDKLPHEDIIYRVGGDEFIIISETKSKEEVEEILKKVSEQVELFQFSRTLDVPTGINYGVIERTNQEPVEELYVMADQQLTEDKTKTYLKRGIDRRK